MVPSPALAALLLVSALACQRGQAPVADAPSARPPPPLVDHGPAPAYAGTWIGPALTLTFVGPWVIVRPTGPQGAEQAPIELRVSVERRAGDAFALRTSVAGVLPADFLRPPDWTLLVEDEQLAIAMGDEPLTAYTPGPDSGPLLGPAMLDELEPPAELLMADAVGCLELAGTICAELEGGLEQPGPIAAGCRELHWAACMSALGPTPVDPVARVARANGLRVRFASLTLRFADGLRQAAPPDQRDDATAVYRRALERARTVVDELREAGPLPELPELPGLLAALDDGEASGLLAP